MEKILNQVRDLVENSLKFYENGNFEEGKKIFEEAKELLSNEKRIDEERTKEKYGNNLNFGIIHKIMEENSPKLYLTKNGRKIIASYTKLIKENEVLKHQFDTYNAVLSYNKKDNIKDYVNELYTSIKRIPKKDILVENAKLINFLRENNINENIDIDNDLKNIFNSIEYLQMSQKNISNMPEIFSAKKTIEDFLNENTIEKKHLKSTKNIDEELNTYVENADYKYGNIEMNESDKNSIISFLRARYNKDFISEEKVFDEYKSSLILKMENLLEETTDTEERKRLSSIKDKINKTTYSKDTSIEDFDKLLQINEVLG